MLAALSAGLAVVGPLLQSTSPPVQAHLCCRSQNELDLGNLHTELTVIVTEGDKY